MPKLGRLRPFAHRLLRPLFPSMVAVGTDHRMVALTFDDGPDPAWTPRLLEVLAVRDAKATFFMVGARAERHPDLLAQVAAAGHEIGNHSWDHPSLPSLTSEAVADQLRRTRAALAPHGTALMRPPYGDQTLRTRRVARRLGYTPVFWNVSGGDWRGLDADALVDKIAGRLAPGAIVLLHDSLYSYDDPAYCDRTPTLDAVAMLIDRMPHIRFVTVSTLLQSGRPLTRYWTKNSDGSPSAPSEIIERNA